MSTSALPFLPPALESLAAVIWSIFQVPSVLQPLANSVDSAVAVFHTKSAALAQGAGIEEDQMHYTLCLALAYPMALLMRCIPGTFLRHCFGTAVGFMFGYTVFGAQIIHTLIMALGAYLLMALLPRSVSPYFVFTWALGYLSAFQMMRMYVSYMRWTLDIAGPMMILVVKLSAMAFNYHDGGAPGSSAKASAKVLEGRKARAIKQLPNIFEFISYVFFFGGYLSGPAFEIKEYLDFIKGTGQRATSPPYASALKKALISIAAMVLFMQAPKWSEKMVLTDEFGAWPLWRRIIYCEICATLYRCKYYFGFFFSEAASNLAGLGVDEDGGWDGLRSGVPLKVELGENVVEMSNFWNMNTARWLRRYVYERSGSLGLTYLISAFWHGFYPGYYMFFLSWAILQTVAKKLRKSLRPLFTRAAEKGEDSKKIQPSMLYRISSIIITRVSANYLGLSFIMMSLENSKKFYSNMNYFVHVGIAILWLLFAVGAMPKPPKPEVKKA